VLVAVTSDIVLLREVIVAGMVLAYLLDPLATRVERLEMNRSLLPRLSSSLSSLSYSSSC
jgi:predicted PurR-regulated permease PerM